MAFLICSSVHSSIGVNREVHDLWASSEFTGDVPNDRFQEFQFFFVFFTVVVDMSMPSLVVTSATPTCSQIQFVTEATTQEFCR